MNSLIQRLSLIALTAGLATLTACGGGGGDTASTTDNSTTTTAAAAPASAPAGSSSAVIGKSLYQSHCASCHGGNPAQNISQILKGTSAGNTLNAIARDEGGMGYLQGTIGSNEANSIAAYLAQPNL